MNAPSKLPELVRDWIRLSAQELVGLVEDPNGVAERIVRSIVDEYGSQQFYLPGNWHRRAELARKIYAEFNGSNQTELIKKYKRSGPTLYRLIQFGKALELRDRQGDLFGVVDA